MNYVDRRMFVLFCVSIWAFVLANLLGTVYLCYRADCPVEILREDSNGEEPKPTNFKSLLELHVQSQYKNSYKNVTHIVVEWCVDGVDGYYRGTVQLRDGEYDEEISFSGSMGKYNTGWKVLSFSESR